PSAWFGRARSTKGGRRSRLGPMTLLARTAAHAARYIETLSDRPVAATASIADLRRRLAKPLPEAGLDAPGGIVALWAGGEGARVRDVEGGLMGSTGGRFFGWVIGGTLPAALAADWLTSAWDQNAASNLTAPAEAVVEEVTGAWLKELLGLPAAASFGFVTGC